MSATRVLVTGATGFMAGDAIEELLRHGYAVRGTVRDRSRADTEHLLAAAEQSGGEMWQAQLAAAEVQCAGVANAIAAFEPVTMVSATPADAAEARAALSDAVDVANAPNAVRLAKDAVILATPTASCLAFERAAQALLLTQPERRDRVERRIAELDARRAQDPPQEANRP